MNFALSLGFSHYRDFASLAQAAEESGFSSVCVADSLFHPLVTTSKYPYAGTEAMRKLIEVTPFIEPFIAMSTMAAVTRRVRVFPGVLKVPVRQPLVLAKLLTSLAAISGGRVALGAGFGTWREDYIYNGVPFDDRGTRMDECIAIIRGVMSGDYFEYHSKNYDFGPLKLNPVPAERIPILIGGHSVSALKRAARLGDGWVSANANYDALKRLIRTLNQCRSEFGTAGRKDFEIVAFDSDAQSVADFKRLEGLGVTEAGLITAPEPVASGGQAQVDAIRRFGDSIIARFR